MFDLIREIGQTLVHNKVRTALTGFAVAWGIFMLIVLLGMSHGVSNSFNDSVDPESSRFIQIYSGRTSKPYKGFKDGRYVRPYFSDMQLLEDDVSHYVREASTTKFLRATVSTPRDYVTNGLNGVQPSIARQNKLKMLHGRFINDGDVKDRRKVVVLRNTTAANLFGSEDAAVGKYVNAMGLAWKVVGVYDHLWDQHQYVPFTTVIALSTDGSRYIYSIRADLHNVETKEDGDAATKAIREVMAQAHQFDPDDNSAIWTYNRFNNYLDGAKAMRMLDMAIWVLGLLTMLSGIVGVSNIMFVSVKERTHEIGIRRAIGAKPRSILLQVVLESVAMTALFGYIGIFFGMSVMQIVDVVVGPQDWLLHPTINISIAIKVTVVLVVAGALAGLFPAMKATKVKPVEALRDE